MKKRLLAGLLAGCIALTGCASILERDCVYITPHKSTTTDAGSSSALRVENYQELVNSLSYLIATGAEGGVIRLYMEAAQAEDDLRNARLEVLQEYPLAAYAVENITYETEPVLTYTEARVSFTYQRTPHQIASIVSVTGISAVRAALSAALTQFSSECVLRISIFDQDENYIRDLVQQLYYANPAAAVEYPELEVYIYPNSGRQRIVEILFHYENNSALLSERTLLLEQSCQRLAERLAAAESVTPTAAMSAVLNAGGYDPGGGSTAYAALLEGGANSEGLALAMAAVCEQLDIPCRIARGLRGGQPHFWNVVTTEKGWRHVDLTRQEAVDTLCTDESWQSLGYAWLETSLPACS